MAQFHPRMQKMGNLFVKDFTSEFELSKEIELRAIEVVKAKEKRMDESLMNARDRFYFTDSA
jgi:hypothetical protein